MSGVPAIVAVPMHGQRKLSAEGYRTRDGHLIEWFGKILEGEGAVSVVSRPEPIWIPRRGYAPESLVHNTQPLDTKTWKFPRLTDPRRWWVDSANAYPGNALHPGVPIVSWNPFFALSNAARRRQSASRFVVDLLDDWTEHYAFKSINREVNEAYRKSFEYADAVFANAEGTAELARRFGRNDVVLIPNGTDPERFSHESRASGPVTVGYVGKIGKRLDLDLIISVANNHPNVTFMFAGPILDAEYRRPLKRSANIHLLGDVHYDRIPALLRRFDIGWVPHRVGEGEVGGDVIKTYEYRAAALPVLTTPIVGAGARGLSDVHVVPGREQAAWLHKFIGSSDRIARRPEVLPESITWEHKARTILQAVR